MKTVTLASLIQTSKDGEWGKGEPFNDSVEMAVVRGTDFDEVRLGKVSDLPVRYIPKRIAERKTLQANDIVFETAGGSKNSPTGRSVFIKPSILHQLELPLTCASFSRFIRIDPEKANPGYVYWYLQYLYESGEIQKYHKQHTGVARFQYTDFSTNELLIIPSDISIQNQIADILFAYEDLIENNTRQIKILEEMVRLIYREWFVNFRFPRHEQVKMVDSQLGLIPEGWAIQELQNMASIVMGQSPKSEFYNEVGEGLPFHQGVSNFTDRFPIDTVYCTVFNRIAEAGDILFSVRAPVGRINIANKKIIIGRGLCGIRSKTGHQAFLFQQLKEQFKEEDLIGGGTIFKSVTKADMQTLKLIAPPLSLQNKFEDVVQSIFLNLEIATLENINLRKTRDLLLPKLISGEIDLETLKSPEIELWAA